MAHAIPQPASASSPISNVAGQRMLLTCQAISNFKAIAQASDTTLCGAKPIYFAISGVFEMTLREEGEKKSCNE